MVQADDPARQLIPLHDPVRSPGRSLATRTLGDRDRRAGLATVRRAPRTIRVELDGSGDFHRVVDAVAASGPRDTILVGPGRHPVGDLVLEGHRTLRGRTAAGLPPGLWERPPAWRPGDPVYEIDDDDAPEDGFRFYPDYEGQHPFVGSGLTTFDPTVDPMHEMLLVEGSVTLRDDAALRDLVVAAVGPQEGFDERAAVHLAAGWPTVSEVAIRQWAPKACLEVSGAARPLVRHVRCEGPTRWTGGAAGRADGLSTRSLIVDHGARPVLSHCSSQDTCNVAWGARPVLDWCSLGSEFTITGLRITGASTTAVVRDSEIIGGRFGAVVAEGGTGVFEGCTIGATWTPGRLLVHPWMQERLEPDHPDLVAMIRARRLWTFGLKPDQVPAEWRDTDMFTVDIRDAGSAGRLDGCRLIGPGVLARGEAASLERTDCIWDPGVLHRYTRTLHRWAADPSGPAC